MTPQAIHPISVQIILEHIARPSALTEPLPADLISASLRQRHHFLNLSPAQDIAAYLSWPSPDQQGAIDLLESTHQNAGISDVNDTPFLVRYASDGDFTYAHVCIHTTSEDSSSGLRLVFQWDAGDEAWKYHNVALMPFPDVSYDTIEAALSPRVAQPVTHLKGEHVRDEQSDDDSYWDAYGQGEDGEHESVQAYQAEEQGGTEDAYWAQYATVQGSGDSTLPSPLPSSRRRLGHAAEYNASSSYEGVDEYFRQHPSDPRPSDSNDGVGANDRADAQDTVISIPYNSLHPPSHSPGDPVSPHDLSDRLTAIKPQPATPIDVPFDEEEETVNDPDSKSHSPSLTVGPEKLDEQSGLESRVETVDLENNNSAVESGEPQVAADRQALKDSINGIYRLWLASHPQRGEVFLDVVKEVVGS